MHQDCTQSGISCIGPMAWGTHLCQFYEDRQDLVNSLVPYFKVGIEDDEGCLWVASPPFGPDDAAAVLRTAVPDLDRRIRAGQIEIVDYRQWYTPRGHFDADAVLAGWTAREEKALARGFAGLRVTGNTFWIEDQQGFDTFIDYEARLNEGFRQHRMVCICSYSLARASARDVLNVVHTHDFAVVCCGGEWDVVESAARKVAKEQLLAANEELECRVAERTSHLQHALADKEVLLREIHHRVKNNLQIINSLMTIRKTKLKETEAQNMIEEVMRRINAISLVHEALYLDNTSHNIDFSAYLAELARGLLRSYGLEHRVTVEIISARGVLCLNEAIPVGLIATEVITNSLKYAFPDGRHGRIEIAFANSDPRDNVLTIRDSGVGLPKSKLSEETGAGMMLIDRLAAQVGGEATFSVDGGTAFRLSFPTE